MGASRWNLVGGVGAPRGNVPRATAKVREDSGRGKEAARVGNRWVQRSGLAVLVTVTTFRGHACRVVAAVGSRVAAKAAGRRASALSSRKASKCFICGGFRHRAAQCPTPVREIEYEEEEGGRGDADATNACWMNGWKRPEVIESLEYIKNPEADECDNGMDKTKIVIEPVYLNYIQCEAKNEEGSIAGYHTLRNAKISDFAEPYDGLVKKMEKDKVT